MRGRIEMEGEGKRRRKRGKRIGERGKEKEREGGKWIEEKRGGK